VLAQRDLLANVSHELRTPLSRIRVALEVAADANDKVPALLGEIAIDLGEVEQILTDIVTTARLDVASAPLTSLPLHVERIAIDAVCQHAVERFHAQYPDRRLEVSVPRSLGFINVDPVLFRRVLDNVLENAAKYSPEASLVCLRAQTDNDRALLVVSDCGSGITAEDLPHVFEPFFRGERSRSRSAGGVGLGLTLAKRIVDAHGGSIQVASNKAGTTVTVIVASAPP